MADHRHRRRPRLFASSPSSLYAGLITLAPAWACYGFAHLEAPGSVMYLSVPGTDAPRPPLDRVPSAESSVERRRPRLSPR
ncbi:hypothetical protein HLK59_31275 [Streptomyces sp. S3(2020)]|uniref:hypothetical protein n=1 Tax=Streptomyces sp. S3(2020) TaxID=2732044 RepID=UPI0014887F68|nr:hypothetical protein [Streptomyces sp. S3(2020)]NNN34765.1 hypothetical protein [Streptomyces sp. S3(2020)]